MVSLVAGRAEGNLDPAGTFYRIEGQGADPPVVLIHGVGLDSAMWDAQATALAPAARVIRYDMLGHGRSANPPGPRVLEDFVAQLEGLLDHLGLPRVRLAGFSMGGLVAQAFAAGRPERLDRLAVLHSIFQRSAEARAAVMERCEAVAAAGPLANLDAALERWFSPAFRAAQPAAIARIRETFAAHRHDGYLKAYRLFAGAGDEVDPARLAALACPVLVATGELDSGSTPEMARALAAAIPGAACVILPGERHMAPVESPAQVNRMLVPFLSPQTADTPIGETP